MRFIFFLLTSLIFTSQVLWAQKIIFTKRPASKTRPQRSQINKEQLYHEFLQAKDPQQWQSFKKKVYQKGKYAVPTLVKVIKEESAPIQGRWVATFLLGKIMGKAAIPFLQKLLQHPHWAMRLAGLKTLFKVNEQNPIKILKIALEDPSMLVKYEALGLIKDFRIHEMITDVRGMLLEEETKEKGNPQLIRTAYQVISSFQKKL